MEPDSKKVESDAGGPSCSWVGAMAAPAGADTGFYGGSGELRKGGCSHKAEEELQVTSADSSATGQRRPARGHASTLVRGET